VLPISNVLFVGFLLKKIDPRRRRNKIWTKIKFYLKAIATLYYKKYFFHCRGGVTLHAQSDTKGTVDAQSTACNRILLKITAAKLAAFGSGFAKTADLQRELLSAVLR
jgi:hypothetical protein